MPILKNKTWLLDHFCLDHFCLDLLTYLLIFQATAVRWTYLLIFQASFITFETTLLPELNGAACFQNTPLPAELLLKTCFCGIAAFLVYFFRTCSCSWANVFDTFCEYRDSGADIHFGVCSPCISLLQITATSEARNGGALFTPFPRSAWENDNDNKIFRFTRKWKASEGFPAQSGLYFR